MRATDVCLNQTVEFQQTVASRANTLVVPSDFKKRPEPLKEGRFRAGPPMRPVVLLVGGHDDTLALNTLGLSAMGFDVVPVMFKRRRRLRIGTAQPDRAARPALERLCS
jgi:hypothetical protein